MQKLPTWFSYFTGLVLLGSTYFAACSNSHSTSVPRARKGGANLDKLGSAFGEGAGGAGAAAPMAKSKERGDSAKKEAEDLAELDGDAGDAADAVAKPEAAPPPAAEPAAPAPGSKRVEPTQRALHYDATLGFVMKNGGSLITAMESRVKAEGGYAEKTSDTEASFQIPKDRFLKLYAEFLKLPNLSSHTLQAQDITADFSDAAIRLDVARASLRRLEALLKRATTATDRLGILHKIADARNLLEQSESTYKRLAALATYSTLTVSIQAPQPDLLSHEERLTDSLRWIAHLSPTDRQVAQVWSAVKTDIAPDEFVIAPQLGYWRAEAASGTFLTVAKAENNPEGSTQFWADAVTSYWNSLNLQTTVSDVGEFKLMQFPAPLEPYLYFVGVAVDRRELYLVEVYYKDKADFDRLHSQVETAISKWKRL